MRTRSGLLYQLAGGTSYPLVVIITQTNGVETCRQYTKDVDLIFDEPISMDKKYRTQDGRPVRVLCVDADKSTHPVVVLIGKETVWLTAHGKLWLEGPESVDDLYAL
jgi:hypothetical protein